jgi:hypothetical protein
VHYCFADALNSDPRIHNGGLYDDDILLPPVQRERLPALDLAVPALLRQRAAELRAGPAEPQASGDQAAGAQTTGEAAAAPEPVA